MTHFTNRIERPTDQWVTLPGGALRKNPYSLRGATVEVRHRDGTVSTGPAEVFQWRCTFGDKDVMQYRIIGSAP
jgi:hypothetical protein